LLSVHEGFVRLITIGFFPPTMGRVDHPFIRQVVRIQINFWVHPTHPVLRLIPLPPSLSCSGGLTHTDLPPHRLEVLPPQCLSLFRRQMPFCFPLRISSFFLLSIQLGGGWVVEKISLVFFLFSDTFEFSTYFRWFSSPLIKSARSFFPSVFVVIHGKGFTPLLGFLGKLLRSQMSHLGCLITAQFPCFSFPVSIVDAHPFSGIPHGFLFLNPPFPALSLPGVPHGLHCGYFFTPPQGNRPKPRPH